MKKRKYKYVEEETSPNSMAWLCTFNDLMTLLMVFFMMIFSLGSLDKMDIRSARIYLQSGLGIFDAGQKTSIGIIEPLSNYDIGTATFTKQLEESIETLDSEPGIEVIYTDEGIVISLDETVLFKSGSADINPDGFVVLDNIAATILNAISNLICIEGHTDSDPIQNDKFPSNWELSTARSVNVLKYLAEKGKVSSKRLSAVGYGESKPLVSNNSDENKSKNRRVEIIITSDVRN